ncbi:MAG: hypothetical protein L6Q92_11760 [Phycisphaerae bacterium]|nr:hypothetical protein [Phycisphaerae bacterium]
MTGSIVLLVLGCACVTQVDRTAESGSAQSAVDRAVFDALAADNGIRTIDVVINSETDQDPVPPRDRTDDILNVIRRRWPGGNPPADHPDRMLLDRLSQDRVISSGLPGHVRARERVRAADDGSLRYDQRYLTLLPEPRSYLKGGADRQPPEFDVSLILIAPAAAASGTQAKPILYDLDHGRQRVRIDASWLGNMNWDVLGSPAFAGRFWRSLRDARRDARSDPENSISSLQSRFFRVIELRRGVTSSTGCVGDLVRIGVPGSQQCVIEFFLDPSRPSVCHEIVCYDADGREARRVLCDEFREVAAGIWYPMRAEISEYQAGRRTSQKRIEIERVAVNIDVSSAFAARELTPDGWRVVDTRTDSKGATVVHAAPSP